MCVREMYGNTSTEQGHDNRRAKSESEVDEESERFSNLGGQCADSVFNSTKIVVATKAT